MHELQNWKEVTQGLYRWVIGAGCCYEIHVLYHSKNTDILTANASLYIVGDWIRNKDHARFFERELLLTGPVSSCLQYAMEDKNE